MAINDNGWTDPWDNYLLPLHDHVPRLSYIHVHARHRVLGRHLWHDTYPPSFADWWATHPCRYRQCDQLHCCHSWMHPGLFLIQISTIRAHKPAQATDVVPAYLDRGLQRRHGHQRNLILLFQREVFRSRINRRESRQTCKCFNCICF